jgi:hypothetical protein
MAGSRRSCHPDSVVAHHFVDGEGPLDTLHEQRSVELAAEDLEHLRDLGRPSPAVRAVSTGP